MQGSETPALLREAADLYAKAADLRDKGRDKEASELEQRADSLRRAARRRQRVGGTNGATSTGTVDGVRGERTQSARELIIASLAEVGVPAAPRTVAEYAAARFGHAVDSRAMASLRRDELRAWESTRATRVVYVVPALEGRRFLPMRARVTLSEWPLERRIIGPWSERADHLTATANFARQFRWLSKADPTKAELLQRLLVSHATTVPGAVGVNHPIDAGRIETAAQAELDVIRPMDEQWRAEAAERARQQLDEKQQLWGFEMPYLIRPAGA